MSLFSRTRSTQPVVIFDIGSASIGGAVVSFEKDAPEFLYCTRAQLPFQEVAEEKRMLPQIAEVLGKVAGSVQSEGLKGRGAPQEIVCILSSLWCETQTTSASFEHKERFKVTDRVMDNLLAQIQEQNAGEKSAERVEIEGIVINSLLNGYPTQSPLGKETTNIHTTFLESSITKELHEKIESAIGSVFSADTPLHIRSFLLASFSVARDISPNIKDFLVVDVTGEVTEIAVVRDFVLGDTLSFPYGRNTIVRNVAQKTGSVPEDVLSRIKTALSDGSDERAILAEEEKQWVSMFGKACEELTAGSVPLPQHVFLVTDPAHEGWFQDLVERVDFSQFTATKSAFSAMPLARMPIEHACTTSGGGAKDHFLIIGALFYNREYQSRNS